ncbi:MAG: Smr/MutS family protein [Bacteroidota bacterium]
MSIIELDLRHIYNNSRAIEDALQQTFDEAIKKRIREVAIIQAKGGAQLYKKIEKFLQQPSIKKQFQRMENDSKNSGRVIIYFKY